MNKTGYQKDARLIMIELKRTLKINLDLLGNSTEVKRIVEIKLLSCHGHIPYIFSSL